MALKNKELQSIQISEGIVHLGECNSCITLRLNPISANLADLATGQERQLTKGKRAERTKHDFRCPICRSAIGQASCLICARRRQLTFPFCCYISLLSNGQN